MLSFGRSLECKVDFKTEQQIHSSGLEYHFFYYSADSGLSIPVNLQFDSVHCSVLFSLQLWRTLKYRSGLDPCLLMEVSLVAWSKWSNRWRTWRNSSDNRYPNHQLSAGILYELWSHLPRWRMNAATNCGLSIFQLASFAQDLWSPLPLIFNVLAFSIFWEHIWDLRGRQSVPLMEPL